jgi:hypothetical protein
LFASSCPLYSFIFPFLHFLLLAISVCLSLPCSLLVGAGFGIYCLAALVGAFLVGRVAGVFPQCIGRSEAVAVHNTLAATNVDFILSLDCREQTLKIPAEVQQQKQNEVILLLHNLWMVPQVG